MHNLRHFYYQNRRKIWKVVLIIAFLLVIIYFMNKNAMDNNNKNLYTANYNKEIYYDKQNNTYISDKSAITGETVTEKEVEKINSTISKFLQYCKNGKKEEAYKMLSEDCKKAEYNTIKKFEEKYLNKKFSKNDVYQIENWKNNTYKITISKDILVTGDVTAEGQIEYITTVTEDAKEKININGYIGQKEINKSSTEKDVNITIVGKKTYLDYEIYEFKIKNSSNKTININTLQKIGTMYLEDSNGNRYNAYSHEIFEEDLEVKTKREVNVSIKYANNYSTRTSIRKVVFKDVILDYNKYKKAEDKEKYEDRCDIVINLSN